MDDLLTTEELARYLRLSPRTVEDYRYRGKGPEYKTLPTGAIRYKLADVDAWIASGMEEESDE
jgi:excisionase family DNA binding protein